MFKYISNDELAAIIKSKDKVALRDYIVIDVRDDDYRGGNIVNALNSPSGQFLANVDDLVKKTKDIPIVVFHCALSQVRGPKAARIYSQTRDMLQSEGQDKAHEVLVLRGGFTEFQAKFKDDPELVANYDPEAWQSEWI
ncbi:Rhodanese-like protein [Punctularia strigosozonata HHB-11173 SS5]|uniref:Rhodanese-like protein n=1 Tax=Punctularia strigosozonata (strain HHB-11173) TaxID=741275 RepID=UPI000441643F|nr:Rhodanese-like protein [Punctularia strigosozonata HHB-11173 SS5]EIN12921.1 Rhodanese-like protein [Punctularia strigosozonata HHB-11173 SS5]